MTLDLDTRPTSPTPARDNFGKPFGQNMYNYEWFIGDRTSIVSYGWFEFWNVSGARRSWADQPRCGPTTPFGLERDHQPA